MNKRASTPAPVDLRPMLATLVHDVPLGDDWSYEMKWDGVRALVLVRDGKVRISSRAGRDTTLGYPELAALGDALASTDALLDGEIVAFDDSGRPSFQMLQRRMHVRDAAAVRVLRQEVPVAFMIFDLLWLDGTLLTGLPYHERRRVLDALELASPHWQTPPASSEDGAAALATSRELGLEGIVAKRIESTYEPGRRSPSWRKVKHELRQEFVVGGWSPGKGGRAGHVGALLLGYYDDAGALRYAGKVGTGFTEAELDRLDALFGPRARPDNPFTGTGVPREAHFVEPNQVAEVRFTEWTDSGRIRHPAYFGLRDDKRAGDVIREG